MARMIDADRLLRELTALSHGQVWPGWTYDGIRLLIERQPTLTQPNESATDTNVGGKDNDVSTNEPLMLEVLAASQLLQMLGEKVEVIMDNNMDLPQPNEPLTLKELTLMTEPTPVWWDWVQGWVLARKGMIISWNGVYYNFEEVKGNFYRRPPEGEEGEKHVIEITENL